MITKFLKSKMTWRWLLIGVAAFLVIGGLIVGLVIYYQTVYAGKIYRGVRIGLVDVSGLTPDEALTYLKSQAAIFNTDGISFEYQDQIVKVRPTVSAAQDLDLTYEIFSFDLDKTVAQAFSFGREGAWPSRLKDQAKAIIPHKVIKVEYRLNEDGLKDILKSNFSKFESNPVEPKLILEPGPSSELKPRVAAGQPGNVFNYQTAVSLADQALASLQYASIGLSLESRDPLINYDEASNLLQTIQPTKFLSLAPIKLVYEDKKWEISQPQFKDWLDFGYLDGNLSYVLKGDGLLAFLAAIAKEIDRPALDAKFKIKNGRVAEFQGSQDGLTLSLEPTAQRLNRAINQEQTELSLVVEKTQPQVTTANVNDLGIREIIGLGTSNFARSPRNRRHNIAVGAAQLNGVLIKPGEEFSLVKTLGEVSGATGYREELVIKGNKTIPEFGGGLCQIGTTTFRAALGTGLPITERQNHSYRVVYYEPAGVDATIYSPKPDFKFINDTGNHILVQTKIIGDELIFEFWGTKDGRQFEQSKPRIYNVTAPPPQLTVETEDLKPGEKKCTERAHAGADAEFSYKVTYAGGEVKEQVFTSHYRPWQAVCLVGKESSPPGSEPGPGTELGTDSGAAGANSSNQNSANNGANHSTPVLLTPDLPVIQ